MSEQLSNFEIRKESNLQIGTDASNQIQIDYDGSNGNILLNTVNLIQLTDSAVNINTQLNLMEAITISAAVSGSGTAGMVQYDDDILQLYTDTWKPIALLENLSDPDSLGTGTGFEPLPEADIQLSYTEATRTLEITTGTSYDYWLEGQMTTVSTTKSIVISDTTGPHFIYFNSAGILTETTDPANVPGLIFGHDEAVPNPGPAAYIAFVELDDTAVTKLATIVAYEGHYAKRNQALHLAIHLTEGAKYYTGFNYGMDGTMGGQTSDDIQLYLSGGTIFDEELQVDIVESDTPAVNFEQRLALDTGGIKAAYLPIFYKDGTVWKKDTATQYPIKWDGTRPTYNSITGGVGTQVQVPNNDWTYVYVAATTDVNEPVLIIQGQSDETTRNNARNAALDNFANLSLTGLPFAELKILYILLIKADSTPANARNAAISDIVDVRDNNYNVLTGVAPSATDHNNLIGLQGGIVDEYYHITATEYTDFQSLDIPVLSKLTENTAGLLDYNGNQVSLTDGSGTADYVTKWIDSDTIGSSLLYDGGTFISLGGTSTVFDAMIRVTANLAYTVTTGILASAQNGTSMNIGLAGIAGAASLGSESSTSIGVKGTAGDSTFSNKGIKGNASGSSAYGVGAEGTATNQSYNSGIYGASCSNGQDGLGALATYGTNIGGIFEASVASGTAVGVVANLKRTGITDTKIGLWSHVENAVTKNITLRLDDGVDNTGKYLRIENTDGDVQFVSAPGGDVATDTIWDAAGDLAVGTGLDTAAKLSIGTSLQVLRVNAGATALEWADGGSSSPLTTKGDIYTFSTVDTRLPAGTDDQLLSADSSTATGLKWVSKSTTETTTTTDATPEIIDSIINIEDDNLSVYKVFIKALAPTSTALEFGAWERTLVVRKLDGVIHVEFVSSDVDSQGGLEPTAVTFEGNSAGELDIEITGIDGTTINWSSSWYKKV